MQKNYEPKTIVRRGSLETDLLSELKKFDKGFRPMPCMKDMELYALNLRGIMPSLTVVTRPLVIEKPVLGNVLVTITSYEDQWNQDLLEELNRVTSIDAKLEPPADNIKLYNAMMRDVFQEIIRIGPNHMDRFKVYLK